MALIGTVAADYPNVHGESAGLNFYIDGKDSGQTSIIQQYGSASWNGIINGATWSSEGGGSWFFDGSNDRVVFGSDATTVNQSDSSHTYDFSYPGSGHGQVVIDAWINPSTTGNGKAILSKRTDNQNWPRFELILANTNSFDCNISTSSYGASLMYSSGNDNIISAGTWYHIGWSFTQGGTSQTNSYANRVLWLNGVKIATGHGYYASQNNLPCGSNRPFTMGNVVDGSSWNAQWYHGYVAIIRVYSCQAGSTTERRGLAQTQTTPAQINENIIKLHYDRERGRFGV